MASQPIKHPPASPAIQLRQAPLESASISPFCRDNFRSFAVSINRKFKNSAQSSAINSISLGKLLCPALRPALRPLPHAPRLRRPPHNKGGHECSGHVGAESILSHLAQLETNLQASAAESDNPGLLGRIHSSPSSSNNYTEHEDQGSASKRSAKLFTPSAEVAKTHATVQVHSDPSVLTLPNTANLSLQASHDNDTRATNTLYETLFDDSEFTSMFNTDDFGHHNAMIETGDDSLCSGNCLTSVAPILSDQMNNDMAVPDLTSSTSFTSFPLPALIAPQASSTLPTSHRFNCTHPNCNANFNRIGDLRRHDRVHGPPAHPCTIAGCTRRGGNAFYRRDKLLNHLRKKHGMAV
ncbi:uncharacterized protein PAC_10423 [Phialocephala subalpina]|uniref:C2H2-type domain-containing protein n=1 Tax=Phialocephala subalpina TaxID=576137 RepID=A0A1L7X673_9HELO|nr:uncharacterized protein PAC_10423 [Phialocephala subalpina]